MLESVDIKQYLATGKIEQVICGGESSPDARICDFAWILQSMQQCVEYEVPFWFKQTGARFKKRGKDFKHTWSTRKHKTEQQVSVSYLID